MATSWPRCGRDKVNENFTLYAILLYKRTSSVCFFETVSEYLTKSKTCKPNSSNSSCRLLGDGHLFTEQYSCAVKYILNIATVTCTMSSQQYSFLRYVLQELYYLEILCPMTLKSFEF